MPCLCTALNDILIDPCPPQRFSNLAQNTAVPFVRGVALKDTFRDEGCVTRVACIKVRVQQNSGLTRCVLESSMNITHIAASNMRGLARCQTISHAV